MKSLYNAYYLHLINYVYNTSLITALVDVHDAPTGPFTHGYIDDGPDGTANSILFNRIAQQHDWDRGIYPATFTAGDPGAKHSCRGDVRNYPANTSARLPAPVSWRYAVFLDRDALVDRVLAIPDGLATLWGPCLVARS